jgi:transposase-like protein
MILKIFIKKITNMSDNSSQDDECYTNNEIKLLNKEIKLLKKEIKFFKNENNLDMIIKNKILVKAKKDEIDKIQLSLFSKDMKQFSSITLHAPRQAV